LWLRLSPVAAAVEQFMSVAPYSKAQRVSVIVDNGSAHRSVLAKTLSSE
jgi:hypothetical protein